MEQPNDEPLLKALQLNSWAELTVGLVPQLAKTLSGMDPALAASILPKLTGEVFEACSAAIDAFHEASLHGQDNRHESDLKDQDFVAHAYDLADSPEERSEIRNDYREAQRARYAQETETNRLRSNMATKVLGAAVFVLVVVIVAGASARPAASV